MAQQQQAIHKFVLGNKDLEGKNAEFQYDHGWYSIIDIVGEERNVIYKSRNAQEAYTKWNVYIGRKKERPQREHSLNSNSGQSGESSGKGYMEQEERKSADVQDYNRVEDHTRQDNYGHQENRSRQESRGNQENRSRQESRGNQESRSRQESRGNQENQSRQENRSRQDDRNNRNSDNGKIPDGRKPGSRKKSDAHRQLEKRKAKARKDWAERRKAEDNI